MTDAEASMVTTKLLESFLWAAKDVEDMHSHCALLRHSRPGGKMKSG